MKLLEAHKQETLFHSFRIESNSDNEIWLEVQLDSLLKVLRSADSSCMSNQLEESPDAEIQEADLLSTLSYRIQRRRGPEFRPKRLRSLAEAE
jgi:hypothetical protein